MVSIVTKFIVIYNDIVAVSGPYTDLRCESFPQWCGIQIYNDFILKQYRIPPISYSLAYNVIDRVNI